MSNILYRPAVREDMVQVMELIKKLAKFEGEPDGPKINHEVLERDGFDSTPPRFVCLVAECLETKKLVGHILGNYAYSGWTGLAMYIEELYVIESYRKKKVGHMLLKNFCKFAQIKGCTRIDWHVLMSNSPAIHFYKRHGAYSLEEIEKRCCMKLLQDKINLLANSSDSKL